MTAENSILRGISHDMLLIKTLDNGAHIDFSEYTGQWYVSAAIEIGGDGLLCGITEHANTPETAVDAYMARLTRIDLDHYLVTQNPRRHWRWNGAAFSELSWTYPKDDARV